MIGFLGWVIVTPTLLGILAGRWLDQRLGTGITFAGGLLVAGLALGCWLAWVRIHRE
jgi:ATP synthase protein I